MISLYSRTGPYGVSLKFKIDLLCLALPMNRSIRSDGRMQSQYQLELNNRIGLDLFQNFSFTVCFSIQTSHKQVVNHAFHAKWLQISIPV